MQSPCIDRHHKLQINFIISFSHLRNCSKIFLNLRIPFVLITGDFNCRNSNCYLGDLVTPHVSRFETLIYFYDLNQLIKTPTHLLQNSATFIDLAFINQPNLVMEKGVHSSLCSTCHNQIVFGKSTLKVEYRPSNERIFWDFSRADKTSITRVINSIN